RLGLRVLLFRLLRQQLDAAAVELAVHGLDLERVELHRLEQLDELLVAPLAARLRRLEQRRQPLLSHDPIRFHRQHRSPWVRDFPWTDIPRLHTTKTRQACLNQVSVRVRPRPRGLPRSRAREWALCQVVLGRIRPLARLTAVRRLALAAFVIAALAAPGLAQ